MRIDTDSYESSQTFFGIGVYFSYFVLSQRSHIGSRELDFELVKHDLSLSEYCVGHYEWIQMKNIIKLTTEMTEVICHFNLL